MVREMQENRLGRSLSQRGETVGTWVQINSPEVAETAAGSGFDFVIIDMEHGSFGIDSCVNLIRAVEAGGADAIVRVPSSAPVDIAKVLDAGARGVVVPAVRSGEEAARAIAASRYEPHGTRGACPYVRATDHGLVPWHEHRQRSDAAVFTWLLIENNDAVDNIEAILDAGPDAVMLGPFDLAMSMGHGGDMTVPAVQDALATVTAAARARGIDIVTVLFGKSIEETVADAAVWRARGSRIFAVSSDRWLLSSGYAATARAMLAPITGTA